jgi:hypothetical protein
LHLKALLLLKPDLYCETSFNNKKYEFFLHFFNNEFIEKIRYLILIYSKLELLMPSFRPKLETGENVSKLETGENVSKLETGENVSKLETWHP